MTRQKNFKQVIFERVAAINENNTEEALLNMITEKIKQSSKVTDLFENNGIIAYTVPSEQDDNKIIDNGVYVYCNNSLVDWTYERFETVADAIRSAVKYFNAYIISNGVVIKYDALDENTAYYYSGNKMKIVNLGE